jgi:hypothetical protein
MGTVCSTSAVPAASGPSPTPGGTPPTLGDDVTGGGSG